MKRELVAGLVAAMSFAAFGATRTLTVGEVNAAGEVVLSLSGESGSDQALLAAWASGDRGVEATAWTEFAHVGTVTPADTEKTCQIPASWRSKSGVVRFFLMSETLPYAKRFAYITRPKAENEKDGPEVDMEIVPVKTLDISVKVQSPDLKTGGNMCPFGSTGAVYIFPANVEGTYYYAFLGASATTGENVIDASNKNVFGMPPPLDANPHVYRLNARGVYIDGYQHLAFDPATLTDEGQYTITLFGRNSQKQKGTSCSIYTADLMTNGIPARAYVAAETPGGIVTLYDRVTKTFARVWGVSGRPFEPGPEIGPAPEDCGETVCASAPLLFAPTITVGALNRKARTVELSFSRPHDRGVLLAVADETDKGLVYAAWQKSFTVGVVEADVTQVLATLPETWWLAKDTTRFVWKSMAGLPYDREVASLDSDGVGKAHIRTGWKPTNTTSMSVTARTEKNVCAFGLTSHFHFFLNQNDMFYYGYFGRSGSFACSDVASFVSSYHDWSIGPTGVALDGESVGTYSNAEELSVKRDVTLPFRGFYDGDGLSGKEGFASVKRAQIRERDPSGEDVLVRDYFPCVKDGVPGFYDHVLRTFSPSVTQVAFEAGETVMVDGDALSCSAPVELASGLIFVIR